tara:strand:+ start:4399 stop:4503 length:105 start_codon:yes stop_codon:yes gene_type:complete
MPPNSITFLEDFPAELTEKEEEDGLEVDEKEDEY